MFLPFATAPPLIRVSSAAIYTLEPMIRTRLNQVQAGQFAEDDNLGPGVAII